jgi:large subunit ribosomal protein L7Ae
VEPIHGFSPETKEKKKAVDKEERHLAEKLSVLPAGVNTVPTLVESKKTQQVLPASDVDAIELVVFLPALCRKLGLLTASSRGRAG